MASHEILGPNEVPGRNSDIVFFLIPIILLSMHVNF